MSRYGHLLCVACLFMTLGNAFAGNAPAAHAPGAAATPVIDPKAHALAAEMVALVNPHSETNRIFDTMCRNIIPMITRDNPKKSQGVQKLVSDAMHNAMVAHMDEIDSNTANLYAQNYSIDELQQIIAFYKSPVGQKVLKTMPDMMEKSMSANLPMITTIMREAMTSVASTLKKNGMIVPRELGH